MNSVAEKKIPDIAAEADRVIQLFVVKDRNGEDTITFTTSQIRKFLTAVNMVTNKVNVYFMRHSEAREIPEELAAQIRYLKVKIAYQAGRKGAVHDFVEKAELVRRIDSIGTSRKRYEYFAHFIEALIAYHRFRGGREK